MLNLSGYSFGITASCSDGRYSELPNRIVQCGGVIKSVKVADRVVYCASTDTLEGTQEYLEILRQYRERVLSSSFITNLFSCIPTNEFSARRALEGLRIMSLDQSDRAALHNKMIDELGGTVEGKICAGGIFLIPDSWPEKYDFSSLLLLHPSEHYLVRGAWLENCWHKDSYQDPDDWRILKLQLPHPSKLSSLKNLRFSVEDQKAHKFTPAAVEKGAVHLQPSQVHLAHLIVTNPVTSLPTSTHKITRFCWKKLVAADQPHACSPSHDPLLSRSIVGTELAGHTFMVTLHGDEKRFVKEIATALGGDLILDLETQEDQLGSAVCIGDLDEVGVTKVAEKLAIPVHSLGWFLELAASRCKSRAFGSGEIQLGTVSCPSSSDSLPHHTQPETEDVLPSSCIVDGSINSFNIEFLPNPSVFNHKSLTFLYKLRDFVVANTSGLCTGTVPFSVKGVEFPVATAKIIYCPPTDFSSFPSGCGYLDVYPHMGVHPNNVVLFGFYNASSEEDLCSFTDELEYCVRNFIQKFPLAMRLSVKNGTTTYYAGSCAMLAIHKRNNGTITVSAGSAALELVNKMKVLPSFLADPQVLFIDENECHFEYEKLTCAAKVSVNTTVEEKVTFYLASMEGTPIVIRNYGDGGLLILRRADNVMFRVSQNLTCDLLEKILINSDAIINYH